VDKRDTKKQEQKKANKQQETTIQDLQKEVDRIENKLADPQLSPEEKVKTIKQLEKTKQGLKDAQKEKEIFLKETYVPGKAELAAKQTALEAKKKELEKA